MQVTSPVYEVVPSVISIFHFSLQVWKVGILTSAHKIMMQDAYSLKNINDIRMDLTTNASLTQSSSLTR